MYSMVLMVAMSTVPDSPSCGKKYSTSCTGCTGSVTPAPVYVSSGCSGCTGSHSKGFLGLRHGCSGSTSCFGSSCYGTPVTTYSTSCSGCTGFGLFGKHKHSKGCLGSSSCFGSSSGCFGTPVTTTPPPVVAPPKTTPFVPTEPKVMPPKVGMIDAQPALIALTVPADAEVTIDGIRTVSTSTNRVYSTPAIESDKVYFYTIQSQVVRDGKTISNTERVAVRAGETTTVVIAPQIDASLVSK
jgi:uncharacterized protein (TIGR03000 family)